MKNRMEQWIWAILFVASVFLIPATALADAVQTFDTDPTLSNTQAPGTWFTDRYNPAGFDSEVFGGDNRLRQTISASDSSVSRPASYSSHFYNTQGRQYNVSTTYMAIDLYIPDLTSVAFGNRFAGFWGVGNNGTVGQIEGYPIIEFQRQGALFNGDFGFSIYDPLTGLWNNLGVPGGFLDQSWYTLEMELTGDDVTFTIGDLTHTVVDTGMVAFQQVILQGYNPTTGDVYNNTQTGANYEIYWDNFVTEAPVVPIPGAAGLGLLGLGLVGVRRRFRKAA